MRRRMFTSPHRGEVGRRRRPGEGAPSAAVRAPSPRPSPQRGEGVRRACGLFVTVLLAIIAAPATAQAPPPSDTAKAMAGAWELSNADHDKICNMTFKLTPAGANYAIDLDKACGEAFPATRAIVGWQIGRNDMLLLMDVTGNPVLEMLEVEAGTYEGLRP